MPAVTMPKSHPAAGGVTIADGQEVKPGETVEVSEELAAALVDQGWTEPKPKAKAKATTTDAAEAADTKE